MKKLLGIILVGLLIIGLTACGDSEKEKQAKLVDPSKEAVDLTVKQLEYNEYVRDAAIESHKDMGTIKIAIQTKFPVNEKIAKDLIDEGLKQLSSFNDEGRYPDKNYYGKLWDTWKAEVVVFMNDDGTLILRGDKIAGKDAVVVYTNKGNAAD